jgi:formylglycine-generating enzyme required for sulfatase activity
VGSYLANAFGLHDVIGNVWEWCQDLHAPKRGERQVGAGSAGRVARGGGFFVLAVRARSAFRFAAAPSDADPNLGVRPARALLAP